MAVVYVPQNTRWGDLGKGLGDLLGAYVQARQQQQMQQQVAQVLNDPATSSNTTAQLTKLAAIPGGLKAGMDILKTQATLGLLNAQTQKEQFGTSHGEKMEPGQLAQQAADYAATSTGAALNVARIPEVVAGGVIKAQQANAGMGTSQAQQAAAEAQTAQQVAAGGTGTSKARQAAAEANIVTKEDKGDIGTSTAAEKAAEADRAQAEANLLKQQQDRWNALVSTTDPTNKNSKTGAEVQLDQMGVTDPKQRAYALGQFQTGGLTGWDKAVGELQKQSAEASKAKDLPELTQKTLATGSKMATYLEPFLTPGAVATDTGLGGGIEGYFAKKGVATDPDVLRLMTAGEQAMGSYVESGNGMGGEYRARIGYDLTPQLGHTAVANVIASQQIAKAQLADLKQQRLQVENDPARKGGLQAIDDQINAYTDIYNKANSLWWGYDSVDKQGNGHGQLHFYYQGGEVDKNTLKPITGTMNTYRVNPGYSPELKRKVTEEDIQQSARQAGMTPYAVAQKLGVQQ